MPSTQHANLLFLSLMENLEMKLLNHLIKHIILSYNVAKISETVIIGPTHDIFFIEILKVKTTD